MKGVGRFVRRFFVVFHWYLMILALIVHLAAGAAVVAVFLVGPGRTIQKVEDVARRVRGVVKAEMARRERERLERLLGKPSPDVFRYRELPDARAASLGYGRVLRVGPGQAFARPSQAAKAARDGDVIEILGGEYAGDTAIWQADDLLIRGVGGVVRLDAKGVTLPQHKAIWIVQGDNVRIENVEFFNAKSRDRNGAGIRAEGKGLHVVSCFFHDNECGILTNNVPDGWLRVEDSEFSRNGHASGQAHQIYVGGMGEFVLTGCYLHETFVGSAVKSRARRTYIAGNRIVDEGRGRSNYTIDLSNGGEAYVVGNILQQGPATENYTLVTYAPEGLRWEQNVLFVVHNTFVNDREGGNFIRNHADAPVYAVNNVFAGEGSPAQGRVLLVGNLVDHGQGLFGGFDETLGGAEGSGRNRYAKSAGFVDRERFDYRLAPGSPAIDAAVPLPSELSRAVGPLLEYRHPLRAGERVVVGAPDVGALEFRP